MTSTIPGFWAVIPAGGSGTRLWPLSRRAAPKFLLDLTGSGQSLLQTTWSRLAPLVDDRVIVVAGSSHADAVRRQLPMLAAESVVAEPTPRDSMPAIGLAAALIERRDPDALLGSFAADHLIEDEPAFHAAIREAVVLARAGELVTIGIEPTGPATGFGYIRQGAPLGIAEAERGRRVEEFVEKPDLETAKRYLASGEYRWNAGMFVVQATTLLELLALRHPDMVSVLRMIAAQPDRLYELWPSLTAIAIDHAVAEPAAAARRVAVVPADLGWDDVGDFQSVAGLSDGHGGPTGIVALSGVDDVVSVDSTGVVSAGSGRLVALVGVEDIVVIDTADALLVTTRDHCQDVKKVVTTLAEQGRTELL
ncbi:MAG: NTP transferase domain-containing protein [Intrasporangium sp.]|uniref:mannose-1-phosphate guanylyltransferase n=1 Tax=Intrasporangium sp. TaxID=1925024 RepID=UPI00264972B9|nr:sugar phosphate nucleotidyltransferase [Intrasporangium sp.]MDN5796261.1 NTP transferase domain-containing protein [Intrasporangium sp.]